MLDSKNNNMAHQHPRICEPLDPPVATESVYGVDLVTAASW